MHDLALADELAEIRADISRLKQREAALRAAILSFQGPVPAGRWHRVEILHNRSRRFDRKLLPDEIVNDPAFYREHLSIIVRTLPVQLVDRAPLPWQNTASEPKDRAGLRRLPPGSGPCVRQ